MYSFDGALAREPPYGVSISLALPTKASPSRGGVAKPGVSPRQPSCRRRNPACPHHARSAPHVRGSAPVKQLSCCCCSRSSPHGSLPMRRRDRITGLTRRPSVISERTPRVGVITGRGRPPRLRRSRPRSQRLCRSRRQRPRRLLFRHPRRHLRPRLSRPVRCSVGTASAPARGRPPRGAPTPTARRST
jgi:hypothetical protein